MAITVGAFGNLGQTRATTIGGGQGRSGGKRGSDPFGFGQLLQSFAAESAREEAIKESRRRREEDVAFRDKVFSAGREDIEKKRTREREKDDKAFADFNKKETLDQLNDDRDKARAADNPELATFISKLINAEKAGVKLTSEGLIPLGETAQFGVAQRQSAEVEAANEQFLQDRELEGIPREEFLAQRADEGAALDRGLGRADVPRTPQFTLSEREQAFAEPSTQSLLATLGNVTKTTASLLGQPQSVKLAAAPLLVQALEEEGLPTGEAEGIVDDLLQGFAEITGNPAEASHRAEETGEESFDNDLKLAESLTRIVNLEEDVVKKTSGFKNQIEAMEKFVAENPIPDGARLEAIRSQFSRRLDISLVGERDFGPTKEESDYIRRFDKASSDFKAKETAALKNIPAKVRENINFNRAFTVFADLSEEAKKDDLVKKAGKILKIFLKTKADERIGSNSAPLVKKRLRQLRDEQGERDAQFSLFGKSDLETEISKFFTGEFFGQ